MAKEIIALPATPGRTVKVKKGTEVLWRQNPRSLYRNGVLPWQFYRRLVETPVELLYGIAGLCASIPSTIIFVGLSGADVRGHSTVPNAIWALIVFGPSALGTISGIIPGIRQRRILRDLQLNITASFSAWVNERYNLHTTPDTFNKNHVNYLLRVNVAGATGAFTTDGKTFNIRFDDEGNIYIEDGTPKATDYRPDASIAATESTNLAPATELTGEAALLATKLFDLLKLLADLDVSIEHGHVIKRVREDLQTTLDLHRNLLRLGEVDQASQQIIITNLTDLGVELDGIVTAERDSINRQLRVQQAYIRDRAQQPSDLTLTLGAAGDTFGIVPTVEKSV